MACDVVDLEAVGAAVTRDEMAEALEVEPEMVDRVMASTLPISSTDAPIPGTDDLVLEDVIADENVVDPIEDVDRDELRGVLEEAVASLEPREREILRARFGRDDQDIPTLEEIGKRMGISRERVRQLGAWREPAGLGRDLDFGEGRELLGDVPLGEGRGPALPDRVEQRDGAVVVLDVGDHVGEDRGLERSPSAREGGCQGPSFGSERVQKGAALKHDGTPGRRPDFFGAVAAAAVPGFRVLPELRVGPITLDPAYVASLAEVDERLAHLLELLRSEGPERAAPGDPPAGRSGLVGAG